MVLLTVTPSIVEAIKQLPDAIHMGSSASDQHDPTQPSLDDPTVHNPISHEQIIGIWKALKSSGASSPKFSLEKLLLGSQVYVPPPPPKPEPVRPTN